MIPDNLIVRWRKRMTDERLSSRTISFYCETIHAVLAIMEHLGCTCHPHAIRPDDVTALLDYLKDNDYAIQTRKGYITALRKFCRAYENPTVADWPKPRFPHDNRPNADWLTTEQARALLDADKTPLQEIVIHLELCLGLRHVEVIRLKQKDIDDSEQIIQVWGKGPEGGKPRTIPYARDTAEAIGIWKRRRDELATEGRARYPVTFTDPETLIVWSKAGRLYSYAEEGYGLDKVVTIPLSGSLGFHFSNHTLRRTFGRALFRAGVEVPTIAAILGHESTDVTLRYIGVNLDDMRGAMNKELF